MYLGIQKDRGRVPRQKKFDLEIGDHVLYTETLCFSGVEKTYAVVKAIYPHIFLVDVLSGNPVHHSFTKSQYLCGEVKRIK